MLQAPVATRQLHFCGKEVLGLLNLDSRLIGSNAQATKADIRTGPAFLPPMSGEGPSFCKASRACHVKRNRKSTIFRCLHTL